ncbi:MAG: hydrogenase maturation protease [Candidatus Omnitrophica bacterium]|nr:hydrogenase maturation protease [Candidatus Omnitrophota bacterium]
MSKAEITKIIGCGNLLLQDEGIGIHLINSLKMQNLPENVELVDAGCGGFDIIPHLHGIKKVVIVDAIKTEAEPGAIFKFTPEDFTVEPAPLSSSLHDICLKEVLMIAQKLGPLPPVIIFGVQPKTIDWGMSLSKELETILPRLSELVIKEALNA